MRAVEMAKQEVGGNNYSRELFGALSLLGRMAPGKGADVTNRALATAAAVRGE